jgi:hypothetical protein
MKLDSLFFLLFLHFFPTCFAILNLRRLTKKCASATANEELVYCGTFPKDCEKTAPPYSCEFITTVEKFVYDCPTKDLRNPYLNILCAKRLANL